MSDKAVLKDVVVVVDSATLSGHAFNVDAPQEKDQVDVSGFSTREYVAGLEDSSLIVQFIQDFGTVHPVLYPLYTAGTTFVVYIAQPHAAGTAYYGGSATMYTYNGLSGALNARAELTATFRPAGGENFAWGTVAPS